MPGDVALVVTADASLAAGLRDRVLANWHVEHCNDPRDGNARLERLESVGLVVMDLDGVADPPARLAARVHAEHPASSLVFVASSVTTKLVNDVARAGARLVAKPGEMAALAALIDSPSRPLAASSRSAGALSARYRLSPRQAQVLAAALSRRRYVDIAMELGISVHTVKRHIRCALDKCRASSVTELAERQRNAPESDSI